MLVSTGRYGTLSFWTSFFLQVSNWQVPTGTVWYLGRYLLTRSLYLVGRQVGGRYLPVPGQVRYGRYLTYLASHFFLQVAPIGRQVTTVFAGRWWHRRWQVGRYRQVRYGRQVGVGRKVPVAPGGSLQSSKKKSLLQLGRYRYLLVPIPRQVRYLRYRTVPKYVGTVPLRYRYLPYLPRFHRLGRYPGTGRYLGRVGT